MSKLSFTVDLDLPPGWVFESIWCDFHSKEETERWGAEVMLRDPSTNKTVMSIGTMGATPEAALEKIPDEIARWVRQVEETGRALAE
jgi:hypothetical protein